MSDHYARRGVSAGKEDVHFAISQLDAGLYPKAFCKVIPDLLAGDPDYCMMMHADGAGTKTSLAYLYWKETGDLSVWRGIAQDGIVMNTDDLLCAGAVHDMLFSNTIGRNKFLIPKEVLAEILAGMEDVFQLLAKFGVKALNTGGETADVGDLVRTLIFDATACVRLPRKAVITNEKIQAGDVIVGLASFGQAHYEDRYNAGMGSNGLTLARHAVLAPHYRTFGAETYDPSLDTDVVYTGKHQLTDPLPGTSVNIGQALLSPTRTYLPVMREVLGKYHAQVHGLIHCTGGGQTKCLKFVDKLHIVKDNLFSVPPLFQMIQDSGSIDWREMYQVFNMGHRLEIYTDADTATQILSIAASQGVDARIVGYCLASDENKLTLHTENGTFEYPG